MKTHLRYILIILGSLLIQQQGFTQVGINNPNPDPSAILDLVSNSKGFLVPRMITSDRLAIADPAEGLMVYDTEHRMYYTYDPNRVDGERWLALNPYNFRDGATFRTHPFMNNMNLFELASGDQADVGNSPRLFVDGQVIIGGTFERPPGIYGIMVEGDSKFKGKINFVSETTFETQPVFNGGLPNFAGTIGNKVDGGPSGDTYSTTFIGHGTIPVGGIIMWSGDPASLPPGWVLCNGQTLNPEVTNEVGGSITVVPDLRDRFIVGADVNGGATLYEVNNTGGTNSVTLTESQMPNHRHSGSTNFDGTHSHPMNYTSVVAKTQGLTEGVMISSEEHTDGNDDWYNDNATSTKGISSLRANSAGSHNHGFNTNYTGGGTAHENRPPYYALAFIMRVK